MSAKENEKRGHGWTLLDSRDQGRAQKENEKCGHGWTLFDLRDQDDRNSKHAAMDGRFLILAVRMTAKVTICGTKN
jgi:hypothetical protein